jgi:hypothetical protein
MDFGYGLGEAVLGLGDRDEVRVVVHETVSPDGDPMLGGLPTEEREIEGLVFLGKEDTLAPVAPLDNVMRTPRNDEPR